MNRLPKLPYASLAVLVLLLVIPVVAEAADYATFESFYRKSWYASWKLAAVVGIIVGIGFYLFAPPLGPVTTAVGTWIGGLFGYSGIAATNFGLALLGGGSVAAGGLGMAGGAAVIATALTFSTDIVLDYAVTEATEAYSYSKFSRASREMLTLPPPRNSAGPKAYEDAFSVLKAVEPGEPLSSNKNQAVIAQAFEVMQTNTPVQKRRAFDEDARADSLRALLRFIADDYRQSQHYARLAIQSAQAADEVYTLPSFLLSASMLYDDAIKFDEVKQHLTYAIHKEPDNPMGPLALGVFLDRLLWRINNDRSVPVNALDAIAAIAGIAELDEQWTPTHVVILSRYLLQLLAEQNRVTSLSQSDNDTIRRSEKTLQRVKRAMTDYGTVLEGAHFVAGRLIGSLTIRDEKIPSDLQGLWDQLNAYSADRSRLEGMVAEFTAYHARLAAEEAGQAKPEAGVGLPASLGGSLGWLLFGLAGGAAVGVWFSRSRGRS